MQLQPEESTILNYRYKPVEVRLIISNISNPKDRRLAIAVEAEDWYHELDTDTRFNGLKANNLLHQTSIVVVNLRFHGEIDDVDACKTYAGYASTDKELKVLLRCYARRRF